MRVACVPRYEHSNTTYRQFHAGFHARHEVIDVRPLLRGLAATVTLVAVSVAHVHIVSSRGGRSDLDRGCRWRSWAGSVARSHAWELGLAAPARFSRRAHGLRGVIAITTACICGRSLVITTACSGGGVVTGC